MAAAWIEEQRQQLSEIYNKCREAGSREHVLEAFTVYLLRILNGLSQMEGSKLYRYEARILGEAMKLFCAHYIAQVDSALQTGIGTEKKMEIILDIEDAISKISNVYKNVIDSTTNSDRQMFTSQAVETSIYDISPKLFAAYSTILETLVRLFEKQGIYAFLLHPSLKSNIETASLFDMRKREGKVVLIYIPENKIENIRQIPIYLLHEVFHVLTKEERNRKDRARRMEIHVHNAIYQRIFKGVDFNFIDMDSADEIVKKRLMKQWFDIDSRQREIDKMDKDDRKLYGGNVVDEICRNWNKWLSDIFVTLGKDLCQIFDEAAYKPEENPYSQIVDIEWRIHCNLVETLAYNQVGKYAVFYMKIYREAYADIACVLTTGISARDYEQAFEDFEIVSDDVISKESIRALRIYIVAKVVASCYDENQAGEWEELSDKNNSWKQKTDESYAENVNTDNDRNSEIQILHYDLDSFVEILTNCGKKLWCKIGQKDSKFESFRNIVKNMDLVDILDGKINEKLRELW